MSEYPLALSSWDEKEIAAIHEVIKSDLYSMGPKVQEFEKKFADFLGVPFCVMVNSGSSANLLGIASLFYRSENPLKPGDEVIVPAVSWSTTYFPLQQYGLKIKFVDIDSETLNFDLVALEKAISPRTKLLVAVNLLGNPNDFKKINQIVESNNLILFEDNCESLGAVYDGQQAGTFGTVGTFSTFFSHHISTMEGGVVAVKDEELYHILLSLRSHGWTRHLPAKNSVTGQKASNPFYESYKFVLPGYNVRPVEMSGAIGICQLEKLPSFIEVRRENAAFFCEIAEKSEFFKIQREVGESSWFGFAISLVDSFSDKRDEFVNFLGQQGVETRPVVGGNFVRNPVIKYLDFEVCGALTNSDVITDQAFFIGNHHVDMKKSIKNFFTLTDSFFK